MEFKELYQKYLADECTPEERAFVEEEIAVTLFYYNDMSISDIAVIIKETAADVKVILYRARKRLQNQLEADYGI